MERLVIFGLIILLGACMPTAKSVTTDVNKDKVEAALETQLPTHTQSGSLWPANSSYLFTDSKARNVGDLITVLVEERASATRNLGTKKDKNSSRKSNVSAAFGYVKAIQATNARFDPAAGLDLSDSATFSGSGSTNNSDTLSASVTAVVTKVFPNGNMEITGRRQVTINHQPQALVFTGIVRPIDVTSDNTIPSSKVAQAMISYGSGGELAEVAHQGWLARTLNQIWPF